MQAQYTKVINSNRPGLSESPYSVGLGVYQLESSIFYRKVPFTETFSNPQSAGINLLFRSSFFLKKLEFHLNTSLSKDKIGFKNVFKSSYNTTGFSQFTLAAKYLVYAPRYDDKSKEIRSWKERHSFDWKRWIPHIGLYAGLNFGNFLTNFYKRDGISPKLGVLLQNEFSNKLNLINNLFFDRIGTDFYSYSYLVTGTYNFNTYWSGFAEFQGILEKYERKSSLGLGLAYLLNRNTQINASLRANAERKELGMTTSFGISYRIDRHEDKFIELDEFGNKIEKEKPIKYDKDRNFFGKIFARIKKLFKKKREQKVDLDILTNKEKTEFAKDKKPKRKRERQGSLVDIISKQDSKLKKKATKKQRKDAKKAQKEAQKKAKRKIRTLEKEAKRKTKKKN